MTWTWMLQAKSSSSTSLPLDQLGVLAKTSLLLTSPSPLVLMESG